MPSSIKPGSVVARMDPADREVMEAIREEYRSGRLGRLNKSQILRVAREEANFLAGKAALTNYLGKRD